MTFSTHKQLMAEVFSSVMNAEGDGPMEEIELILHDADFGDWLEGAKPHYMLRLVRAVLNDDTETALQIAGEWVTKAATQNAELQMEAIADVRACKLELVR